MLAWSSSQPRSLARLGADNEDLISTIERSVKRRRRLSIPVAVFSFAVGTLWCATGFFEMPASLQTLGFRNVGMLGPVAAIAFASLAAYELFLVRARLTRELKLLAAR